MKKYVFILLSTLSIVAYAQDCDELPKRSSATVFPSMKGLEFGGVDEVINCGDVNALDFTNGSGTDLPFSLFIWMNRANSTNNHILISKYANGGGEEYLLAIVGTTLRMQCLINTAIYIGRTAPMSTTGTWIGIAMTYDGSESQGGIKLYSVTASGVVTRIDNANLTNGAYTGMNNTAAHFRIGSAHQAIWFFEGKLAGPLVADKELSTSELAEIATVQNGDYRKVSFYNNIVSAWYFPNGQNDYPTYTDYKSGHNGTMTNMESTDIILETPK